MKEHRISAGAIIIQGDKILLVRYGDRNERSYLVGPGGGVYRDDESVSRALKREVKEETGLEVSPFKLLFVEDLLSSQYRHIKVWFLCNIVGGEVEKTRGAIVEGITEVRWYGKDELTDEVVYPPALLEESWNSFIDDDFEARYLELKVADF